MKQLLLLCTLLFTLPSFATDMDSPYDQMRDLNIDMESIMCTLSWAAIYKPVIEKLPGSDKLKHCTLSCMLAKSCNEETTFLLGILKELSDMMGQGTPEYEDILANIKGIQISLDLDTQLMCYPTCKKSF